VTGAINELNANKANQSDLDNTNNNVSLKANATQVYTKNETDSIATNLRSKNTQITMNDLAQDVKTAMTGGNVAVVGEGAVQTINVIDKAITSVKRTVLGEFAQISTKSTPVAISETNKTLTFVDTSFNVLSYRNTNVFIPANTSIDITGNNSSASIYFDTVSSSFIVKEVTGVTITEHCIRIGIIWWVDGKITSIFGNFDYTINGRTKDRYWLQKYNNQMLYGYIMMNDGVAVIDTTAKTLILPNSNMYLLYGGSYVSLVSFKGMSIDITGNGTHCKLYYDLISNAFSTSAPTKLSVDWVTDKVFLGMIDLSIPQNSHLRFNFTIKSLPFLDSRWAGRTINCLGDSITYGAGGTSWTVSLPKLLKATVNNYGVSGTGIINNGINSFLQRYSNMVNADLICVWGGVNDHHWRDDPAVYSFGDMTSTSDKSFYGALKQLCEGLINKYPTSSIMFITPMKNAGYISGTTSTPNWNQTNRLGKTLTDYRNAIIQVCDYYSIPVLDFYAMSGISPMVNNQSTAFLVDGLHPNAEGNVKLSSKIASFMNNL
jgi:lysophospholipase L1-like esterase